MRSLLRKLRSPAVLISILALVVGVTGAAVADPGAIISKLTKKEKKQVRNIADGEVTKLAPTLSVNSANTAGTANSVAGGGVKQSGFQQKAAVSINLPNTAAGDCGSISPPALAGVPSGSAVIMTPPSGKPVGWTTIAGVLNGGGVYLDFCDIDGGITDPSSATYLFDIIAP